MRKCALDMKSKKASKIKFFKKYLKYSENKLTYSIICGII